MPRQADTHGRLWRRIVKTVLNVNSTCHLCNHPLADSLDHVLPVTERPDLEWEMSNLRPVHHKPCPFCTRDAGRPIRCNMIKGGYSTERAKKIIAERTGNPVEPKAPKAPPSNAPEGRPW